MNKRLINRLALRHTKKDCTDVKDEITYSPYGVKNLVYEEWKAGLLFGIKIMNNLKNKKHNNK
jgi:hypothetical protein